MIRFTFFRTPKPRQFDYRPRYYDLEKEARDKRREELLGESATSPKEEYRPGDYIRRNMRSSRSRIEATQERNRKMRTKPIRLVIILIGLAFAAWWLLS